LLFAKQFLLWGTVQRGCPNEQSSEQANGDGSLSAFLQRMRKLPPRLLSGDFDLAVFDRCCHHSRDGQIRPARA